MMLSPPPFNCMLDRWDDDTLSSDSVNKIRHGWRFKKENLCSICLVNYNKGVLLRYACNLYLYILFFFLFAICVSKPNLLNE